MNYLVTGGCGFIGSHLVDALIAAGHEVRILDDLSTGSLAYKPAEVELLKADICDHRMVAHAMEGMDGCFHLAAVASVERGNTEWVDSHRTNVTGAVTVFDVAAKEAADRGVPIPVVYASSAAVYGDALDNPLSEWTAPKPASAYGVDKFGCELHGGVAWRIHGVPNCGLRFFNVYGPRQDPKSPYSGVITIFGNRIKADEKITINGDGQHSRDYVYVGDVVRALIAAMARGGDTGSDVFNVCTGIPTTVWAMADQLSRLLGKTPAIHYGPARPGDPFRSIGNPNNAERFLEFKAETDLATGLAKTFDIVGKV